MWRMTRARTTVCAAVAVVSVGLAGCSGSAGGDGSAASSQSGSSSARAAAAGPSASAASAPTGSKFVEAKGTGLRFAVPDDWKLFDAEAISSGKDKALIKELEKTFSMNADQLARVFGQLDLMVVGPPVKKFAPNVNVVANGLTKLPAASDLATQLEKFGAKTSTPRDETTPLGPAIVVPYTLSSGGNEVKGRSIVLEGPKGFVTITVSHVDDAAADALTATILTTAADGRS